MNAKYGDIKVERRESFKDGKGGGFSRFLLPMGERLPGSHFRMIAENTLDVGSEIGFHAHPDDDELFVIIEGKGLYREAGKDDKNDKDGKELEVGAGDMLFLQKGGSHGLKNTGETPLRLIAVIAD